ncbi:hypothetical protein B1A87_007525 [Arthrobacter sp. KBS0703]|uniref:hypothetical protein n=1 Tax=Arthrobacter sp. KBS0703 TaxID=1955698 RepID=UPI001115DDE1|nr:hypothetical protein [Arthrobacter sp. KBS0703]TSE15770.1 hypothetical protein B1A87_007525 [Arthrobacter sp. KBS0703]
MITASAPKSAAMVQQRRKDSKAKRQAVLAAIEAMERTRTPITVAEVARRARVSPWLVRQEPLITAVRKAQTGSAGRIFTPGETSTSSASLQVERDLLRQENQRLRHELRRSQQRISELLGDQIDGTDAHSQTRRVKELTDQNAVLSRIASDATQEAHRSQEELAGLTSDLEAGHAVNRSLIAQLNRTAKPS